MAHRQEEEQAARKKAGQGAVHAAGPEQMQGRTKPRIDEMPVDDPPAQELPGHTPQGRMDLPGKAKAGGDQGRNDEGGQGRLPDDD